MHLQETKFWKKYQIIMIYIIDYWLLNWQRLFTNAFLSFLLFTKNWNSKFLFQNVYQKRKYILCPLNAWFCFKIKKSNSNLFWFKMRMKIFQSIFYLNTIEMKKNISSSNKTIFADCQINFMHCLIQKILLICWSTFVHVWCNFDVKILEIDY